MQNTDPSRSPSKDNEVLTRHILAPTHGGGDGDDSHVILVVNAYAVAMVAAARKVAGDFDISPAVEDFRGDTKLLTPRVGGEYVFTRVSDVFQAALETVPSVDQDLPIPQPRLLPAGFDVSAILDEWRDPTNDVRWASGSCRYLCDSTGVECRITDKYSDIELYTEELAQIFEALAQDFLCEGFEQPSN